MIESSRVIDFQEASERLAPVRKRDVAMPHSMIRYIARFLYETCDSVQNKSHLMAQKDTEILKSLDMRMRHSLVYGYKSVKVSRVEIDKMADWFVNMLPESQEDRNQVSSALMKLNKQFTDQAEGPKNPDFENTIKKSVKK